MVAMTMTATSMANHAKAVRFFLVFMVIVFSSFNEALRMAAL